MKLLALLLILSAPPAQNTPAAGSVQLDFLNQQAQAARDQGDIDAAAGFYHKMLSISPSSVAVHNNLGLLFFNARRYPEALVELQRAHALDPKNSSVTSLLGMNMAALHRYAEAIALLRPLAQQAKLTPEIESELADLLIAEREYYEAARYLRDLEKSAPSANVDYREQLCYVALAQGASEHLEKTAPDSYYSHELRGEALSERGNYRAALPELTRALALGPDQHGAHSHLGDVYWSTGDWENAEHEFLAELKLFPDDCYAKWKLANSRMALKREDDQALRLLEETVAACPELRVARKDRAIEYLRFGRNDEALTDLLTANKHDPDEPSIHFQLNRAYSALKRPTDAQREMRRFAELEQMAHGEAELSKPQ